MRLELLGRHSSNEFLFSGKRGDSVLGPTSQVSCRKSSLVCNSLVVQAAQRTTPWSPHTRVKFLYMGEVECFEEPYMVMVYHKLLENKTCTLEFVVFFPIFDDVTVRSQNTLCNNRQIYERTKPDHPRFCKHFKNSQCLVNACSDYTH